MSFDGKVSVKDLPSIGSTSRTNKSDPRGKSRSESSSDKSGYASKSRSKSEESVSVPKKEKMKSPDKKVASGSNVVMTRCFGCDKDKGMSELKTCSRCRNVQYCSVPCQRKDYPRHREECLESIRKKENKEKLLRILDDCLIQGAAKDAKPVKPNEAVKAKEAAKPVKQPGEGKSAKSFKPAKPVSGSKSSSSKKKMPKPHRSGCRDPWCMECSTMSEEEAERKRKFDKLTVNCAPEFEALMARRHEYGSETEFELAFMRLIPTEALKYLA